MSLFSQTVGCIAAFDSDVGGELQPNVWYGRVSQARQGAAPIVRHWRPGHRSLSSSAASSITLHLALAAGVGGVAQGLGI